MAIKERLACLRRLARPGTWRFLALVLTDPRWEPLYDSVNRRDPRARFRNPTPWFAWHSFPVLEEEVARRKGQRLLEWGAGASTLWWAERGLRVTAIEHDRGWYEVCRSFVPDADVRWMDVRDGYASPALDPSDYGVFVIDGRERVACASFVAAAIQRGDVRRGTLLIFDDSNRERYRAALEDLASLCAEHRSYSGPTSVEIDKLTTFFWV